MTRPRRGQRDPQLHTAQRRRVQAQVRAEEPYCAACGYPIDQTRCRQTDPLGSVVDEIIARNHGGSAEDRANCRHMHRLCNGIRGTKPLTPEVRTRCRTSITRLLGHRTLSTAW
jgi:ribosomal protein L37E